MERNHRAYCFEFDAQGLCVTCRAPRIQFEATDWPKGTWYQERLAKVLEEKAHEMRKVQ